MDTVYLPTLPKLQGYIPARQPAQTAPDGTRHRLTAPRWLSAGLSGLQACLVVDWRDETQVPPGPEEGSVSPVTWPSFSFSAIVTNRGWWGKTHFV